MPKENLEIFIITYNRAISLGKTLDYLANSKLKNFKIKVLNNHSTDDTLKVCSAYSKLFTDFTVITNKVNIGAGANFLRALEISNALYTWILCDDDFMDLTHIDDVLQVISQGEVDLIHVGAHKQKFQSSSGSYKTPKELLLNGYAYFKFSSFVPCNIFKTKEFIDNYLVSGYKNIYNYYPHMPFAFGVYEQNRLVYISQHQIVFAAEAGQSYTPSDWYLWWMRTCELLKSPSDVRIAYLDQWKDNGIISDEKGLNYLLEALKLTGDYSYVNRFIDKYFTTTDKIRIFSYKLGFIRMKDKLYWINVGLKNRIKKTGLTYNF